MGNSIIISTSSNYQKNTYQIPIGVTNGTYRIRVTYQDDRCLRDLNISCVLGESGDFKVDSHNELWPKFDLVPSFPSDNVEVVSIYRTDRSNVPFAVDSYLYYGDDFKYLWSLSITGLTETSESGDDPFIKLHGPGVYTLVLCRKSTPQKFCTPNSPDTNSLSLEFPLKGGIY